jgi:hypothetical protein
MPRLSSVALEQPELHPSDQENAVTLPAAGWFPDPQDRTKLRWWDGRTWAGSTKPAPRTVSDVPVMQSVDAAAVAAPSFSVATAGAAGVVRPRALAYGAKIVPADTVKRFSVWAWGAIMFASASVFMNPWGALSALGVAFGVIAVIAPTTTGGWRAAARSVAISAIVLGLGTGLIEANSAFGVVDALARAF